MSFGRWLEAGSNWRRMSRVGPAAQWHVWSGQCEKRMQEGGPVAEQTVSSARTECESASWVQIPSAALATLKSMVVIQWVGDVLLFDANTKVIQY